MVANGSVMRKILQAYKTIKTGQQRPLFHCISTDHLRNTRSAASGQIRFGKSFRTQSTFKYRALQWYNRVHANVKIGNILTSKKKLKVWVKENVPLDWG
jgi:hypothetical protein